MNKKAVSPVWRQGGPALWPQPRRQTTLALSHLRAHLCVAQSNQPLPAAARVVRTVDCGRLHHSPVGRPEWVQSPDAPPADRLLVTSAAPQPVRSVGVSPPVVRRHHPGSPQRRLCGDGCGPLRRGVCGPRNGGRPCAFAAVLHHSGPPRVNALQCDGRWQPALASDLAPSVAADRHSTLSGPHPTARPQLVSPVAQTSRRPAPARLVPPRHGDPHRDRAGSVHRSGAGLGGAVWAAPGTPGRTRTRFQRSQTGSEYVTRRLAQHVSLSRRSRDPKIHQRLRGIFRPTQTQVSATPRAGAVPSQRIFALVCAPLPTLKTNSFWPLFPE